MIKKNYLKKNVLLYLNYSHQNLYNIKGIKYALILYVVLL